MILARLSVLAGLDIGYELSNPGHLAVRASETTARVATSVILRRVSPNSQGGTSAEGGLA